jgi:predicted transcriptional regulator
MVKTTVYLEGEVALALRQIAKTKGRSQAELIREALDDYTRQHQRPPIPGVGEFRSSEPGVSVRAEEILREASKHGKWRRTNSRRGAHR